MTTTTTTPFEPMDPAELEGKTRAELLEICRAAGFRATGWKRDRMAAALTGAEAPPQAAKNVLAGQLQARRDEREGGDQARKAREAMLARTGACQSASGCCCESYESATRDAFGWQLCACQHTQWAHARPAGQEAAAG